MALTTPAQVEQDGGLTVFLFNPIGITTQVALDALVQQKINVADAWLQRRAGSIYGSPDANVQTILAQAEVYLALHYLTPILRSLKTTGLWAPLNSEDAASYDALTEQNWRQEAISLLDEWLSLEDQPGKGFAMPQFLVTSAADPTIVESMEDQLEDEESFARGIEAVPFATVTR